jgi:hypothetical protein
MARNINDPVRSEATVRAVVAAEEQALLEQLRTRAPQKKGGSVSLHVMFCIF